MKHEKYIDIKRKTIYEAEVVGIEDFRTIVVSHNEADFLVKTNRPINILKMLSNKQIKSLSLFLKDEMKDQIFNVKVKKDGLIKDTEITSKDTQENLVEALDLAVKKFIDSKRENSITYLSRFVEHKGDNEIEVKTNSESYILTLDLTKTNYSRYNDDDRDVVNKIVKSKLEEGNLLKITTDVNAGYSQLSIIKYKKDNEWVNLNDEIEKLINPYEETLEYGKKAFKGIVSNVIDGDTIELFNGINKVKVRLDNIDAPESDQLGGREATRLLTEMIISKEVKVVYREVDKYGRIVGTIYGKKDNNFLFNMNREMVEKGMAWAEGITYKKEEMFARQNDIGIWVDDSVYPKNFRDNKSYFIEKQKPKWKKQQEKIAKKGFFNKKN